MANSTPSSVVNELAKSNKVTAHYQVVQESGPAHQKLFKVHLRIGGNGPFEGVGSSLKNARNAAASRALMEGAPGLHVNPTVELNILSMKSGEMSIYRELDSVSLPSSRGVSSDQYDSLFTSQQYQYRVPRALPNRVRKLWRMSVTICGRTYIGEGHTKSEARGNAASHALLELKPLLLDKAKMMEIERAQQQQAIQAGTEKVAENKSSSFVSDLHELANRHHLDIGFVTLDESGPPHVKVFRINCKVGDKEVIGQGVGKRAAKNDAAEKMLSLLQDLPALPVKKKGQRSRGGDGKNSKKVDHGIDVSLDAITYLKQLLQLRKEPQAEYTLKADAGPQQKGLMRFQIEASVGDFKAAGYGESKKAAKLNAATNLLKSLGIDLTELRVDNGVKEIKMEDDYCDILNAAMDTLNVMKPSLKKDTLNRAPGSPVSSSRDKFISTNISNNDLKAFLSAKQKLEYVARSEGFKVMYNDFVKNEQKNEFSCNLAIFTTPPEVFHGLGASVEVSRENAAMKALDAIVNINDASKNTASAL